MCSNNNHQENLISYSLSLLFSEKFVCKHIFSLSLAHFYVFKCAMIMHMCMWVCNIFLQQHNNICMHAAENTQLWLDFCFYSLSMHATSVIFHYWTILTHSAVYSFIFRQLFLEFQRLNFLLDDLWSAKNENVFKLLACLKIVKKIVKIFWCNDNDVKEN